MQMRVLSLEQFNPIFAAAHKLCFYEERSPEMNTYDFALFVTNAKDEPFAYSTILELDKKTAYMQHGGAFPQFRGTPAVLRSYLMMLDHLKARYERISTRIHNQNVKMLGIAMKGDLKIIGMDMLDKDVFLSLSWSKAQ